MNKKELTEEENFTIIEDNRYLNYKVDIAEILAFGNIPEFKDEAERFLCASEVGKFVRKNGLGNHKNLLKFLEAIKINHRVIFYKQLSLQQIEIMCTNSIFSSVTTEVIKIIN